MMAAPEPQRPSVTGLEVVIVGAGPAGLLLAHQLQSMGDRYRITVMDQRPDPRATQDLGRGFVISLSARGQAILKALDTVWPRVLALGVPVDQTGVYGRTEGSWRTRPRQTEGSDPPWLIQRNDLCRALLDSLGSEQSGLCLAFGERCVEVDLVNRRVIGAKGRGQLIERPYDLLVGADGVHSAVRLALLRQPDFEFWQKVLPSVWKSIVVPRPLGFQPGTTYFFESTGTDPHPIHSPFEGGAALPVRDNRVCLLTFWRRPQGSQDYNPQGIDSPEHFQRQLAEIWLPGFVTPDDRARAWFEQAPSLIIENRCNRYHDGPGRAVLLGDAAHSMPSVLAQGCQAAFQDVRTLCDLLEEFPTDLTEVLPRFSQKQVPEGHAISDLNAALALSIGGHSAGWKKFLGVLIRALRRGPRRRAPTLFNELARPDLSYVEIARRHRVLKVWVHCARFLPPLWRALRGG